MPKTSHLITRPTGDRDAIHAVAAWCASSPSSAQARAAIFIGGTRPDDAKIAAVLRAGGWDGSRFDVLMDAIDGQEQAARSLAEAIIAAQAEIEASRRPRGRPPAPEGQRRDERLEVRLEPELRAKVDRCGGASWVRELIRAAREPKS